MLARAIRICVASLLWAGGLVAAAWAAQADGSSLAEEPDWLTMGSSLFGGLALFLFGLEQLSSGLKSAAGEGLKTLLGRLTRNRVPSTSRRCLAKASSITLSVILRAVNRFQPIRASIFFPSM